MVEALKYVIGTSSESRRKELAFALCTLQCVIKSHAHAGWLRDPVAQP